MLRYCPSLFVYFCLGIRCFILSLICFIPFLSAHAADARFLVLNYHDIVETDADIKQDTDVSVKRFEQHLRWLQQNHYSVISIQQVIDAAAGTKALPKKTVLLTFDDGYLSFYQQVFPLLKKYQYPATVSVVGSWLEDRGKPSDVKQALLTVEQLKLMQQSGLVEIASHSYDLHRGILANPQGNTQAAVVTRSYLPEANSYENDADYLARITKAMQHSADFLVKQVGVKPRVMVWPYGEYNSFAIDAAKVSGMPITMGLVDGDNTLADLPALRRLMVVDNPDQKQFAHLVTTMRQHIPLRIAHLDLDYLYDTDYKQTELNLDHAIQRIKNMRINTVFLQAYADPDGDGNADALYFPNRHLPVKQDLFNRAAWQLKQVARVKVYAWLPILAYQNHLPDAWYVQEWRDGKAQKSSHIYTRLSPFNQDAKQFITDIYQDLAKYCNFDGVLFHDDGILSDYEDVSPTALAYTHQVWGLPAVFNELHATPAMRMAWAERKTEFLSQFTDELAKEVKRYRPYIKTARNIYAGPILKPYSEEWYAQSLKAFLAHYDYVAIEAMPFMEEAEQPQAWLTQLVQAVKRTPGSLNKTLFELQAVDWRNKQKIAMPVFNGQVELLKKLGVKHLGFYPDNVFENQPKLQDLQQHFSLSDSSE
ncbi:poly-beta-1,6-N-acetyl-D-glucosamine N-deacetylase PgaB [Methylocucumis oryzae]|uniref:poly-beta-1,6-N-acetyl-D-glucosamine N-deacetylase PgaB n=1 Tax=Methylocucumis oryzae TaxID=1632867 RepID=UPI0009E26B7A|nr:poly-beta-1,6-N-acetyl-D-glucosamine N-deacetylase PgaB [Methylocucumis oryzae]